jgi:hypothetical protein
VAAAAFVATMTWIWEIGRRRSQTFDKAMVAVFKVSAVDSWPSHLRRSGHVYSCCHAGCTPFISVWTNARARVCVCVRESEGESVCVRVRGRQSVWVLWVGVCVYVCGVLCMYVCEREKIVYVCAFVWVGDYIAASDREQENMENG